MTRRETLIVQLLRAREFGEAWNLNGAHGSGLSVSLLPHDESCRVRTGNGRLRCTCWIRSWLELERCLADLRRREPRLWAAVRARYLVCERRPRMVQVRRGRAVKVPGQEVLGLLPVRGKDRDRGISRKGDGSCRVLVESWDASVAEADWLAGIAWLAEHCEGPLRLPAELRSQVAA